MPPLDEVNYQKPHRRGFAGMLKTLGILLIIVFFFALGILIGRGNLKINSLSLNQPKSGKIDYSSVNQLYSELSSQFDGQLDKQQTLDGIKTGLVNSAGDPYTEYFNPKEAKEFNQELTGSFTGIGAELGTNSDNNIVVISPLSGYPADKAGLKPKDIVAAINGQTTSGISISSAVKKIRGSAGSKVTLTIIRGEGAPFDVSITRQVINIPSVDYKVEGNFGYIKINQFTTDTAQLVQKAATDLKAKNVKGIVLDLRGNPGGYLNAAVDAASLWLNKGDVVVQQKRAGKYIVDTEYASGNNTLKGLPTVVLINSGSASASEILAGALHDHKVATLLGTTSFGKGSVQQVDSLSGGSELKVTVAHWYTPNNKNIDKQGIQPDVKVDLTDQDTKNGKDPQKDKAIQILQSKSQ